MTRSIWNTAIVKMNGNYKFCSSNHGTQKEFREELKANGYQVIKMFNGFVSDECCEQWLFESEEEMYVVTERCLSTGNEFSQSTYLCDNVELAASIAKIFGEKRIDQLTRGVIKNYSIICERKEGNEQNN